jgi:hypothetical protein
MLTARSQSVRDARGCSLLEVLVATTIVVVGVMALAQLFALATHANLHAKQTTFTAILAQQKMEQLRGLAWSIDPLGVPVSDLSTDTRAVPEAASGGTGLSPSPPGALARNLEGYCDFVDGKGQLLGGGTTPPPGAVYVRRWSIEPVPSNPANTLVLQVLVTRTRNPRAADAATVAARLPDEARLVTVKARKAS